MTGSVSFVAGLINSSNEFVVGLYQISSGGSATLLETVVPTKGGSSPYYATPFTVTFATNLVPGTVYSVILWENTSGVVGGTNRVSGFLTPTGNATTIRTNDELIVGTTSGLTGGASSYTNTSYEGWNIWLERDGSGTMFQLTSPVDYTFNSSTGVITLSGGITFNTGERYVVHFYPQISTATPSTPSLISSANVLTANTTLTSSNVNSATIIQSATSGITVTLPALSTITDFQTIYLYSMGGSHKNAIIQTQGTDKIQRNSQVTQVILGQNEVLKLYRYNSMWYVDDCSKGVDMVGELFESYAPSELNGILANGTLISRTTYARLWAWVQANLSPISDANFNNTDINGNFINKGLFTTGDGSTTFRVPDLTYYGFRRAKNSPGVFEAMDVAPHNHIEQVYQAVNNGGNKPVGFSGTTGALTGAGGATTQNNSGTETRPNSTGINIFIRI